MPEDELFHDFSKMNKPLGCWVFYLIHYVLGLHGMHLDPTVVLWEFTTVPKANLLTVIESSLSLGGMF
jgi:hypothetical protein